MTWHASQDETDAATLAIIPKFLLARTIPVPVMWQPKPPYVPQPEIPRAPIRSRP